MLRLFAKSQKKYGAEVKCSSPLQQNKEGFLSHSGWEILFCGRKLAQWASEGLNIRPDELWS